MLSCNTLILFVLCPHLFESNGFENCHSTFSTGEAFHVVVKVVPPQMDLLSWKHVSQTVTMVNFRMCCHHFQTECVQYSRGRCQQNSLPIALPSREAPIAHSFLQCILKHYIQNAQIYFEWPNGESNPVDLVGAGEVAGE